MDNWNKISDIPNVSGYNYIVPDIYSLFFSPFLTSVYYPPEMAVVHWEKQSLRALYPSPSIISLYRRIYVFT